MKLVDMQTRQAEILGLQESAADEGNEELYNELQTEFDGLTEDINKAEARAAKIAENRALVIANEARAAKAVTKPLSLVTNGRVEVNTEERAMFPSIGQQAQEMYYRALNNGRNKMGGVYEARASSGFNEASDELGGMLVQENLVADMVSTEVDAMPGILERCNKIPITGSALKLVHPNNYAQGTNYSGVGVAYWVGEAGAITANKGKFEPRRYELKKVGMLLPVTEDLMKDAPAMSAMINTLVPIELKNAIVQKVINGDDPATPSGILAASALISVAKEGSQDADTVVFENILKMYARMLPSSIPNSVWLISNDVMLQLQQMSLAVGTGGMPVFLPPGQLSAAPFGTLLGRPIIITQHCPVLGDKGDIILADLSKYNLVERAGEDVNSASSISFYFDTMETALRFYKRIDGAVYPSSAYTPKNAGSTLGSFVTLDERA